MSRAFHHLRTGLFAAGIAAALGFGATEAFAKQVQCWDPELYTCSSHAHCGWICGELGVSTYGICRNNCCYCVGD